MEGLICKENVGRLPPIPRKRRTKVTSPVKTTSSNSYSSTESSQDMSCKNGKTAINHGQARNLANGPSSKTSSTTEDSYRQLSYIIMQELATTECQNNVIHEKLVLNEQEMGSMAKEIIYLKNKISDLEEKLNKSDTNCSCSSSKCCQQLVERCNKFEEKIATIEGLLTRNGFDIIMNDVSNGVNDSGSKEELTPYKNDECSEWIPEASVCILNDMIDFDKLLLAVNELNVIAGEGESKMCFTKSGATFQRMTGVSMTVFANGLIVSNGPFRSYDEPDTQQFLQDILDGYFPSEFQIDYPDGVPFQIDDKRTVVYEVPKQWTAFSGKGHKLGHGSRNSAISRLLYDYSKVK